MSELPQELEAFCKKLLFDEAFVKAYESINIKSTTQVAATRHGLIDSADRKSRGLTNKSTLKAEIVVMMERYLNTHLGIDPYGLSDLKIGIENPLKIGVHNSPKMSYTDSNVGPDHHRKMMEFGVLGNFKADAQEAIIEGVTSIGSLTFKGNNMNIDNKIAVQSVTYIYGVPESEVTDAQIINHVSALEAQADELAKIKTKSSKVADKIKNIAGEIEKLVGILDSRK